MTFFPEPLRPSEGRENDKYRVDPIEADKQSKGDQLWKFPAEEKHPRAYISFLVFIQKLTTRLGKETGGKFGEMSEDALTDDIQELKHILQIVMDVDQSENGRFCARFSAAWNHLLQGVQVLAHTKRQAFVDTDKLKTLLTDIDNYPPNEDHKLGFYLSEFAGESWLPIPFRDILKRLFSDHRANPSHSNLMQWVELINEILQN